MYSDIVFRLQEKISLELGRHVPEGARVALLDYPFHSNVGDCLIWLGQIEYLRRRKCKINFVNTINEYDPDRIRRALPDVDLILLHGGGNFGSVWPQYQRMREDLIGRFHGVKIVQLPQSISYDSPEKIDVTARVVSAHKNVVIFVRDRPSLELVQEKFQCEVALCPDSAFMIGPLTPSSEPASRVLALVRTDKESQARGVVDEIRAHQVSAVEADWLEENSRELWLMRLERAVRKLPSQFDGHFRAKQLIWEALARQRLVRGISILSQGQTVVTDRLHAHILSVLLGKQQVLFDNSNKKLSSFFAEWTHICLGIRMVEGQQDIARRVGAAVQELRHQNG